MYHVMSRGSGREDIFLDDVDRHDFTKTLAEACQKTGWQAPACCLMRNRCHPVLETPNANLVAGKAWLRIGSRRSWQFGARAALPSRR
jgi:REP element-mobilizing transposase RayT